MKGIISSNLDIIMGVFGLILAVATYIFASVDISTKVAIIAIIFLCLLLILYVCEKLLSSSNSNQFLRDMPAAFDEIAKLEPHRIRVISYVGNFTWKYLHKSDREPHIELQMLVRDPKGMWVFPPANGNQPKRKDDVIRNIEKLKYDSTFSDMAHRVKAAPTHRFVRFFQHEPPVRVVVAEAKTGRIGYFGFYPLQERVAGLDYSGTKRPVLRIEDKGKGKDLLNDFVRWFDHYWDELARRPEENEY